ncbi:MAG: Na/Pi cotransporter family protein [Betaproteobacteria bacterium HGW-Betaproteobacteria-1]|jgi:phosphate:Na+ symporter|nr:MAG: Na/Pi cotransporter family protein [Betaproteobacteria bacterium HGW-Betaproteobacteria-1]
MLEVLFPFVGGLGLFLIGMMLLSDGLVAFAGSNLKRALVRFTGTPYKAFASGTLVTVLVQSSSATAVTLIGFVSAGLITFSQAIGVLIGASLGNTATGWIVAELGLKVNLGFYTLILIGVGALLKLLGRGRWAEMGMALAGFGLLFHGLSVLQQAMAGLSGVFNLADLPVGGYGARIMIMLFGLALTAVLQSSSAAIATTLTALYTNTINFDQAASLVVGAAIGTTVSGALVAIGATVYAKRTALAYILFNLAAGLIGIMLLPLFLYLIQLLGEFTLIEPDATTLVAFHTFFILIGVVLFLPFTAGFARVVERMLPDTEDGLVQRLDDSLLNIPAVALEASQRTIEELAGVLFKTYGDILAMAQSAKTDNELKQVEQALDDTFDFVTRIQLPPEEDVQAEQRIAQLHAIDHLLRLRHRLGDIARANIDFANPVYQSAQQSSRSMIHLVQRGLAEKTLTPYLEEIDHEAGQLAVYVHQARHEILQKVMPSSRALNTLHTTDVFRWMERTGHHICRICYYLSQGRGSNANGKSEVPAQMPEERSESDTDALAESRLGDVTGNSKV